MSWTDLLPAVASSSGKVSEPVTATVSGAGKRFRQRMSLVVRPHLLDGGLAWWAAGGAVTVRQGFGEHAGMLRITPKGPHRLRTTGGRKGAGAAIMLPLTGLPGMPADGHRPIPLEHDYGADWLEVTLPEWARTAKAVVAAPSLPAKTPYVSISERVPDPAMRLGRATGGPIR